MLIQKVFHVRHGLEETKAALKNVHLYRRQLDGMKKAVLTRDGVAQFDCEMPSGVHAHCVVAELPTDDPNQALFQSTAGNLEIAGLIEFIPVRDNLTEVQLTFEYSFKSVVHALLDRLTNCTEEFLIAQLQRLQDWLDSATARISGQAAPHFSTHIPQLAQ